MNWSNDFLQFSKEFRYVTAIRAFNEMLQPTLYDNPIYIADLLNALLMGAEINR